MDRAIAFLKDVRTELSKVNWPTRNQTVQYTLVVIGLSLVLAVFLGGLDSITLNKSKKGKDLKNFVGLLKDDKEYDTIMKDIRRLYKFKLTK